ncbi:hypothetical protein QUC31_009798 [Theobroma cacao]
MSRSNYPLNFISAGFSTFKYPMAQAIVSNILEPLSKVAYENAREEWSLVMGFEKEVERLESNLKAIQCELEDAEEKQFMNKRVQHWLYRFKQVSYDLEDVLDDCKAGLDKLQTDGVETSSVPKRKVCPFGSCFSFGSQVARRHGIATRIKEISEEFDEIAKDRVIRTELIKSETQQPKRSESTSFVDVSQILGRDRVKEDIIGTLLSGTSEEGSWNNYGRSGSWILVTTRNESVARQMDLSHVFHLEQLSEEGCWWILAQKAFSRGNGDRCKNVKDIGRKIANKCKGLLLAAKTLGCLLRDKVGREEWQNVLNSEIWKLDFEEDIFSTLLLSYYDLPSTVRPCLLYCAMFPKDYDFLKDDLIQHWTALAYLKSDDNFGRELQGEDYFKCLEARSFLKDFKRDGDGNIRSCKMQDMVHDFVPFLTKYEFVIEEDVKDLRLDLSSKNPRHLSEALQNLFSQSKRLRLLEFDSFSQDANRISPEIGHLIHLRYLSLIDCNEMEYLPEAVCELRNLQSLIIRGCSFLKKLPVRIGNLINLRYLSIVGCHGLTYYPKGIDKLTSLMTLHNIIVRTDGNDAEEFSIRDLQHLDLLAGYLRVELVGNAIDRDEAKRAKLRNKIHLKGMYVIIRSRGIKKEKEVVRRLVVEGSKKTGHSKVSNSAAFFPAEFYLSFVNGDVKKLWEKYRLEIRNVVDVSELAADVLHQPRLRAFGVRSLAQQRL